MSDVIDLMPRLRLKAQNDCKHAKACTVDPRAASLTCDECDAKIDPWMYIRWVASADLDLEQRREAVKADIARAVEQGNAAISQLNDEIRALNKLKYELLNENVQARVSKNGAVETHSLGSIQRRRAKRSKS